MFSSWWISIFVKSFSYVASSKWFLPTNWAILENIPCFKSNSINSEAVACQTLPDRLVTVKSVTRLALAIKSLFWQPLLIIVLIKSNKATKETIPREFSLPNSEIKGRLLVRLEIRLGKEIVPRQMLYNHNSWKKERKQFISPVLFFNPL